MFKNIPGFKGKSSVNKVGFVVIILIVLILIIVLTIGIHTRQQLTQGIYLESGATTQIKLDREYVYTFKIVSDQSYKDAYVDFFVPAAQYSEANEVNLVRHQVLIKRLTITFLSTSLMKPDGIIVSVVSPKSKTGTQVLFSRTFSLQGAKGQIPSSSKEKTTNALFGS